MRYLFSRRSFAFTFFRTQANPAALITAKLTKKTLLTGMFFRTFLLLFRGINLAL
jgi:hypothetical protein